jgi:hypothetical protein
MVLGDLEVVTEVSRISKLVEVRRFSGTFRRQVENNDAGVRGTRRGHCFLACREGRKIVPTIYSGDGKPPDE